MKSSVEILLIRHGEIEWSRTGRHTGRTDVPLTERGRRQADRLAQMVQERDFALVMSSPPQRALETHERSRIDSDVEISEDLLEWDYGIYEGVSTAAIREDIPGWSVWTHPVIDGETVEEVGRRTDAAIDRLLGSGGNAAVFAHGHVLRILAARWLRLPADVGRHLALDTATVSVLGFERENRVIRRWNEGCHLQDIEEV